MLNQNPQPHQSRDGDGVPLVLNAPHPPTIAAQEAINSIPKLLLSFPVPRLVSQMHLETAWTKEAETAAGGDDVGAAIAPQGWTAAELEGVVRGMQHSAQQLLLTGGCTHFFQEQFHQETAPPVGDGEGSAFTTTASAARDVGAAAAPGLKKLLSSVGQRSAMLESSLPRSGRKDAPPAPSLHDISSRQRVPLTRVPKAELWSKNEEVSSMTLRPRRSADAGGAWADVSSDSLDTGVSGNLGSDGGAAVASSAGARRGESATVPSRAAPSATTSYGPRTAPPAARLDALESAVPHENAVSTSFAEWVGRRRQESSSGDGAAAAETTVEPLLYFLAALPLQLRPFDALAPENLTAFLSSLVAEAKAAMTAEGNALQWSTRALLCCRCLAHPHFPADAASSDTLLSDVIDIFARVARDVSTQLHEKQQSRSAMDAADEKSLDKRGRPTSGGKRGSDLTPGAPAVSALLPLLEQLRGFLSAFAVILCNPTLRLVTGTDVHRLEELCHQCLFRLARSCGKELHTLYSSYIVDVAVHLYRCIWNRLDVQRQPAAESFFQQLPLNEFLAQRTFQTHFDGRAVLPVTAAMLAAAQSTLLTSDTAGLASADALQRQCTLWVRCLIHNFLLAEGRERERAEETLAWTTAVRIAEDLVDLLGVPEWPGADLLLRAFVMGLAQLTLASDSAASAEAELLRPLTVDVLGSVAAKLFDSRRFPVPSAILAEMERLGDLTSTHVEAARAALRHVVGSFPPPSAADQRAWEQLCTSAECADTETSPERERHLSDLIASVYMAESQLITSPSTSPDYAAVWLHVRAARLLSWVCLGDAAEPGWVPPGSVDALLRWRRPSGIGSGDDGERSTNWADICARTQAISTQSGKSMLSVRMRHALVSMLFSAFHVRDAQGNAIAVSESVQKKTLAHLARITALHPPLQHYLWPIVRQCVRDESARVREAIVPILLTFLRDAPQTDGDGDAAAPVSTSPHDIAAEVISSLLHLLGDKSVTVVSRAIAAVDVFLTDSAYRHLFATPQGASLMTYIQQKLLGFASPTAEPKHRHEVVKHFLHRWVVTLADSDGALTGAHAQLAKELVALTVMGVPEFPYDVTEDHPLVQVLQRMHAQACAQDPPPAVHSKVNGSGGASAAPAAATPVPARRRSRGYHVDAAQLLHVMRCAAQSLWMRYQCFHSSEDAVACLATLRVLTLCRSEWVMPLAEVLVQSLAFPPPSTSPLASMPEALGGALLQVCQVLHGVLQAPKLPLISLDYLARCLTALLSKYVGPYQQRVIVASCGALCGLITCGAKHRLSAQVNVPYLQLCYSLMNTYYCRVRALLPTLATQPQSVAYTQRFLFLLSEFLRMYPGWRQQPPHPALLDDAATSSGGASAHAAGSVSVTPNQLAKGPGIAANMYQLLEDVLQSCGSGAARERVAVIALRVVASLCMLEPTTYFYRAENQIRAALASGDHNLQLQGLSLLSDFLKEEDQRVDAASRQAVRLDTTALIVGTARNESSGDEAQETTGEIAKRGEAVPASRRGRRAKEARREETLAAKGTRAEPSRHTRGAAASNMSAEDFNSGMSTWIFQQFNDAIAHLSCSSPHVAVRMLCLRLFQQAAQGGLLPPDRYVRVVIALAADVHLPLREQATASLAALCDRHEEVVAASAGRGVVLAFDLHHACGANLLESATVTSPPAVGSVPPVAQKGGIGQSVHAALYSLLHKRSRDNMITTLVRFFYQDGKASHWCEEHAAELAAWSSSPTSAAAALRDAGAAGIFGVLHPLLLLCHLALVLFALPFPHESDVMHLLQQCRVALDLHGQAAVDWLRDADADSAAGTTGMQWTALGALLLFYLRRALLSEYRLTAAKVQRYRSREKRAATAGAGPNSAPLHRGDAADSTAAARLQKSVKELVERFQPALLAPLGPAGTEARASAWRYVGTELSEGLMTETAEDAGRSVATTSATGETDKVRARGAQDRHPTRTRKNAPASDKHAAPTRRKRARSSPSSSSNSHISGSGNSSSEEEEEEESMAASSSSLSTSSAGSSFSTPASSRADSKSLQDDEQAT